MNVHHLEIFYYVARHGGISEAVRNFPYGIQQPAVSAQILQLEQSLGTRLFQRRPFQLTPAGEQLYAFIRPFLPRWAGSVRKFRMRRRRSFASALRGRCCTSIYRE
ncbi:LysR family transcriptional regulator [Chthoniobacter flavus]|uniref:LysR family transcriptional regulator n=1 Tax=Chthoniobacter flavus TaxID=191863 RepID=UPI0018725163